MKHVYARANGHGVWLEDFIEQSFRYDLRKKCGYPLPYSSGEPWVGIMHHPAVVESPLANDMEHAASRLLGHARFEELRFYLRGVVCLSRNAEREAQFLFPGMQTIALPHPTDLDCEQWSYEAWREGGYTTLCAGFFLRDTRILHRLQKTKARRYVRVKPFLPWMMGRDRRLKAVCRKTEVHGQRVTELRFRDNNAYDSMLASSLVVTWLYGASANNVVVECMARCTPLIVNPLPAVVEYLGSDYPLYANSVADVERLVRDEDAILAAHELLKSRLHDTCEGLDARRFAEDLEEFCDACA